MQHLCKCGKPAKYRNPTREQWWCLDCYKVYLAEKEKKRTCIPPYFVSYDEEVGK
jgi:hypothetical protein